MTCKECEQLIYLYKELNPTEKKAMHEHLKTCVSCSSLFAEFQQSESVIQSLKSTPEKFENANPFLTAKIVSAIQKKSSESILEQFLPFVRFSALRYTMAAVSIFLLTLFIIETKPVDEAQKVVSFYKRMPIAKSVRLNSAAFREQIKNTITNKPKMTASFSLSECLRGCRGNGDENACEECSTLFTKVKNEGI